MVTTDIENPFNRRTRASFPKTKLSLIFSERHCSRQFLSIMMAILLLISVCVAQVIASTTNGGNTVNCLIACTVPTDVSCLTTCSGVPKPTPDQSFYYLKCINKCAVDDIQCGRTCGETFLGIPASKWPKYLGGTGKNEDNGNTGNGSNGKDNSTTPSKPNVTNGTIPGNATNCKRIGYLGIASIFRC